MKRVILITGGLITLLLAILWYYDVITEPLVAVGTAIITLVSLIFVPENKNNSSQTKITQNHSGKGDNVAGNKIIKK